MRAIRPARVLVLLLAATVLPATAVLAHHTPQSGAIVALATNSWGMTCVGTSSEQQCNANDFDGTWYTRATIRPGSGNLASLRTDAWVISTPLDSYFQGWMSSLHQAACAPDRTTAAQVSNFVFSVGSLTTPGNVNR
jgi:hypothetical protein